MAVQKGACLAGNPKRDKKRQVVSNLLQTWKKTANIAELKKKKSQKFVPLQAQNIYANVLQNGCSRNLKTKRKMKKTIALLTITGGLCMMRYRK
jgi:hypothetical protein